MQKMEMLRKFYRVRRMIRCLLQITTRPVTLAPTIMIISYPAMNFEGLVTFTLMVVVVFKPAASVAMALITWAPLKALVVSHVKFRVGYGYVGVSKAATGWSSMNRCTEASF